MTDFYDHSTYPSTGAAGASSALRAELDLIEAAFAKLAAYTGNANKIVKINSGATGYTLSIASDDGTTFSISGLLTATKFNGLAVTANGTNTLNIAAGKTLTASNTITLTATDGSTLAIGAGGTLGTAAYTSSGAYLTANLSVGVNEARATVASHATTADIWAAAGNQIDWTGTATTTAFPNAPQAGASRTLICAGACSFTAGANMLIDGVASGSTVTCAANDKIVVRAISTTQFMLSRIKYDGTAQVAIANLTAADVTGTTQTAASGYEYTLTNVAATAVAAPTAASGAEFNVIPANGLKTNTVDFGADTVQGPNSSASGVITLSLGLPMHVRYNTTLSKWVML